MEKEKLIIRNFGPIKNVELNLGRFNILIGEQATGKSTVAKVLAVCRYFSYLVGENDNIFDQPFSDGLESWGLKESIQKETYIEYECHHYKFTVKRKFEMEEELRTEGDDEFVEYKVYTFTHTLIPKSKEFENILVELNKVRPKSLKKNDLIYSSSIPTSFFQNDVANVLHNPFYLPTQRGLQSIFSIGKSSINNLSDALFNQLAEMDGIARHFTNETYIEPLDIYYKNVRGHGYVRKANETEYYSLFYAASGYQSEIPIVLVIKYYNELKKKNKTFLIEEPEQNLFPTAQQKLMEYVVHQTMNFVNSTLLTTQSPYILTSLNNLMYAYNLGQTYPEKVSKEIDKKYWLNPDEVSAYLLKANGSYEDIFDREEGMIKAEKIDSVSTEINTTFNELLNIEFKENELNT